ncbi:glycerophosphodiester phosphodiesterase [Sphingomonas parva]|uniref:Glycerophosphodiester phosphodiesterase n=1 Tax=Sphingomonas parva TaxID=2555898 RepID=A0A4Y8ZVG5_9SPHN|nr:glycerophosphodiester phosphodiesterase family protein [Sphingomonas parva]TFI60011.1 glycerophosphodiester phosphodiesterase [Sphingomonas parva]
MRSSRSGRPDPYLLAVVPVAHRGLHGNGRVENSRAAFEAAIAAGHGIELDVQASRDGEAMVFHDARLDRLTAETGLVSARTAGELSGITLLGSDDSILPLAKVLRLVGGRVPLLIEAKAPRGNAAVLARAVAQTLEDYRGAVGVMSFNPGVPHWLERHAPQVLRGLVVSEAEKRGLRGRLERLASLAWAEPDFLAYDVRDLPSKLAGAFREAGKPLLTWTVRSEADRARAGAHADQVIHELPVDV